MTIRKKGIKKKSSARRPIMELLDLLGQRWVLRILWEMRTDEPLTFRELQSQCEAVSPTILNSRLKELRENGFVSLRDGGGFELTKFGNDLVSSLISLNEIANRMKKHLDRS